MKNKKIIVIGLAIVVVYLVGAYIYSNNADKVYSDKTDFCMDYARKYLGVISKTENITDSESEKWNMAVDVETEMHDLCMIDLNKEALKDYTPTALERYKY